MTQFGCHTHFKILIEVPHPNTNIFSSNLEELEIDLCEKWGGGRAIRPWRCHSPGPQTPTGLLIAHNTSVTGKAHKVEPAGILVCFLSSLGNALPLIRAPQAWTAKMEKSEYPVPVVNPCIKLE